MIISEEDPPVPVLRPEISILEGPHDASGYVTYTVHDPFARTFDQVGYAEAEILRRLNALRPLSEFMEELGRESTIRLDAAQVLEFCQETVRRGLAGFGPVADPDSLRKQASAQHLPWWKKALKGYLYFRIPLMNPDRFLARTLPVARRLAGWPTLCLLAAAFIAGAAMALEQAPAYLQDMRLVMSVKGLAAFGVCLVLVKALHEFAHAYTAKAQGIIVPAMGIVFIVLCPVAYTDVTDAWRLKSRRSRLAITAAGVMAEAAVAGVSLLAWGLMDPGPLRQVAFFFSFSSLASSLLVNLSPFMRFDGYYLLMDLARVDNLQPRAFAMAAWAWRTSVLGIRLPCPEPALGKRGRTLMALFGFSCVIYRISLYLGIALVVYHMFFKVLGMALFAVEVGWFVLLPIWKEASAVARLPRGRATWPGLLVVLLGLSLFLYLALPLSRTIELSGVAVPSRSQTLYAPRPGVLLGEILDRGAHVKQGEVLFTVGSRDLDAQIAVLERQVELLERVRELHAFEVRDKAMLSEAGEEIAEASTRLAGLYKQREQATVKAELDGEIVAPDEGARQGMDVAPRQVLGAVADFSHFSVLTLVEDASLSGIKEGAPARFISPPAQAMDGKVASVNPVRIKTLEDAPWASALREDLPTTPDPKGRHSLHGSYYLLRIDLDGSPEGLVLGQKGKLHLHSAPRSLLAEAWRNVIRALARESGF